MTQPLNESRAEYLAYLIDMTRYEESVIAFITKFSRENPRHQEICNEIIEAEKVIIQQLKQSIISERTRR